MDWSNPSTYIAIVVVLSATVAFARWFIKMIAREDINDAIQQLKTEIIKLLIERLPAPNTVGTNSPRALTDFGRVVSKHADAVPWANQQRPNLLTEVAEKEDFEIEAFSVWYVKKEYENSLAFQRIINKCAYDKGIDKEQVTAVFEIELRDALMK